MQQEIWVSPVPHERACSEGPARRAQGARAYDHTEPPLASTSPTAHRPPPTAGRSPDHRLQAKRDQRIKAVEALKRRAASAMRRRGAAEEADESRAEDEAFALGLSDECPRCGRSFLEIGDTEAQCLHLTQCTDVR